MAVRAAELTSEMGLKGAVAEVDASFMFGFPGTSTETYASLCEEDQELIAALEQCGANLAEPRHVLHYIETATESTAIRMYNLGGIWEVSISPPTDEDDTWFVVFEREDRILTPTNVLADRHLFETMACVHDSDYEGWEACV